MSSHPSTSRTPLLFVMAIACLVGSPAGAEKYLGVGGGALVPFSGGVGWTARLEYGGSWLSSHLRVGGAFAYGDVDRSIDFRPLGGSLIDAEMRTYETRLELRYVMSPGRVTPYLGVTAGLMVVSLDDGGTSTPFYAPWLRTDDQLGFGGGVGGHLGLEVPLFSRELNLFAEAGASYDWMIAGNLSPLVGAGDYGGFAGILGIRARF